MRRLRASIGLASAGALALVGGTLVRAVQPEARRAPESTARARIDCTVRPVLFEANLGQTDERAQFVARGPGYTLFIDRDAAVITLAGSESAGGSDARPPAAVRLRFVGADGLATVEGLDRAVARSNYFIGNDRSKWHTDVPNFARVACRDVLPGTDVVFYGNDGAIEFDAVSRPGADPGALRLAFEGVDDVRCDDGGRLILATPTGDLSLGAPRVYQMRDGRREPVDGSYVVLPGHEVAFEVGAHDPALAVVVDPVLTFSSYFGGSGYSGFEGLAVDAGGSIYATGLTTSLNYPVVAGVQSSNAGGSADGAIVKFDATGGTILYSTYLGGSLTDGMNRLVVDASGNACVVGMTNSTNFPVVHAAQPTFAGGGSYFEQGDAVVAKLNSAGNELIYSTYVGGSGNENGLGISVDSGGNAYVIGLTDSNDFPVRNPVQATRGGGFDLFVVRYDAAGAPTFATYLGGGSSENGSHGGAGIACDDAGNAYITASTLSTNFPVVAPLQASNAGGSDAVVAKIRTSPSALLYATYLGGSGLDGASRIAVDAAGAMYLTGTTSSTDFPTAQAYQASIGGGYDAFVTKLSPTGASVAWSTYLGGSGGEPYDGGGGNSDLALDASGRVTVVGPTRSSDFPTRDALYATFRGDRDGYVAQFDATGTLRFSSYLGGSGHDGLRCVAAGPAGSVCVGGYSYSADFPTANAIASTPPGVQSAVLARITFTQSPGADAGATGIASHPTPTFAPRADYVPGNYCRSVEPIDLDHDGVLDLVAVNGADDTISTLRGRADGTFEAPVTLPAGAYPIGVASGDLDSDGHRDAVVANFQHSTSAGTIQVFFGDGAGGFRGSSTFPAGVNPLQVHVLDVDGDGDDDVVVMNYYPGGYTVFLGDGHGNLVDASGGQIHTGNNVHWSDMGDVDGDGRQDLVLANSFSGNVTVHRNTGGGHFGPAVTTITTPEPYGVSLGDADGDGKLDLALARGLGVVTVDVLRGDGAGGFAAWQTLVGPDRRTVVEMTDLDLDGRADIVVAGQSGARGFLDVILTDAAGLAEPSVRFDVGSVPYWIESADIDRDGAPDLVVANSGDYSTPGTSSISVLLNRTPHPPISHGDLRTSDPVQVYDAIAGVTTSNAAGPTTYVIQADLDGDAYPDVVNVTNRGAQVFRNRGMTGGLLSLEHVQDIPVTFSRGGGAIDVNGDGYLDLVLGDLDSVTVGINDHLGHFATSRALLHGFRMPTVAVPFHVSTSSSAGPADVRVIVGASATSVGGNFLGANPGLDPYMYVLRWDGGTSRFVVESRLSAANPFRVVASDLDGDGDRDLLVTDRTGTGGSPLQIYETTGAPTAPVFVRTPGLGAVGTSSQFAYGCAASATTHDIAISTWHRAAFNRRGLGWSLSSPASAYLPAEDVQLDPGFTGGYPIGECFALTLADIDLDGADDLVFEGRSTPLVIARLDGSSNLPSHRFTAQPTRGSAFDAAAANWDADRFHWPDVLVGGDRGLFLHRNVNATATASPPPAPVAGPSEELRAAIDGLRDILDLARLPLLQPVGVRSDVARAYVEMNSFDPRYVTDDYLPGPGNPAKVAQLQGVFDHLKAADLKLALALAAAADPFDAAAIAAIRQSLADAGAGITRQAVSLGGHIVPKRANRPRVSPALRRALRDRDAATAAAAAARLATDPVVRGRLQTRAIRLASRGFDRLALSWR